MRPFVSLLLAPLAALTVMTPASGTAPGSPAARADLGGVAPLPLTGERRAAFEAYVAEALHRFGVPGAAVAVVEDGRVVYLKGFGVREAGRTQPVTPDTMMMIGSVTKSMTTMLAGTLVDDGSLGWETPLADILPEFAVKDAALSRRLTIRDAFCNCSGIPGLNLESYFIGSSLTPEGVVAALRDVAPAAPYGETFIYNNLLVATGGYALGVAADGRTGSLGAPYDLALRERVLGPIGMTRSTFDFDAVLASGDYALPHATDLSGSLQTLPLTAEQGLLPYRPAGALWSNAREMARYLSTELAHGVAPDGNRIVSAENLEATWAAGVAVPNLYAGPPEMAASMARYGLGWMSGTYKGLRIIDHAGGTAGFTAEIAFVPDAGLGIVILTNGFSLRPLPLAFQHAVEFRLFELLFDQPQAFDAALQAQAEALAAERPLPALGAVDAAAVAPYLGRYANAELGEVSLALQGDRLILDLGDLRTELRPLAEAGAEPVYLLHDPPLSLFSEAYGVTLAFTGSGGERQITITVPASVTGPAQTFVLKPE